MGFELMLESHIFYLGLGLKLEIVLVCTRHKRNLVFMMVYDYL